MKDNIMTYFVNNSNPIQKIFYVYIIYTLKQFLSLNNTLLLLLNN